MRAVVQRVKRASVSAGGAAVGSISGGLLIFLGVQDGDTAEDLDYIITKIIHLRIFEDSSGKMNQSVLSLGGDVLVVSQFTLLGDCRKGRRPSFTAAARPDHARMLYHDCITALRAYGINVAAGAFQEMMEVALVNDGPVTLLLDSKKIL